MRAWKSTQAPTLPPSPPKQLYPRPWMKIDDWDESTREELREEVARIGPLKTRKDKVPFINIVLTGQIKAGKSSYFNSINSVFANRVIAGKAEIGEAAGSLTKELRVYEVKTHPRAAPLPWRIIDTMGLDTKTGEADVNNLLQAVDGHVPDKHEFIPGRDFHYGCRGYVANPTLAEQAHCVAVVVDANQVEHMASDVKKQLNSLNQGLKSRDMPTYIILTHIDEACAKVHEDVKNAIMSIKIHNIVQNVSQKLDLPENQIFPVKNYSIEVDLQDDMDILLLQALRAMLHSAHEHINKKTN